MKVLFVCNNQEAKRELRALLASPEVDIITVGSIITNRYDLILVAPYRDRGSEVEKEMYQSFFDEVIRTAVRHDGKIVML